MSRPRYAFLFPGQASQFPGMGRDLAASFEPSRRALEDADRILARPLSTLCFGGSEAELGLTENTQPAVLAVSVAALRALEAGGLLPAAAAGHSLGEYTAHVAAGTLTFEDALRTVGLRARFMQEAVPVGRGAMVAVLGLDAGEVEALCARVSTDEDGAFPANFNGPAQVVVAGHAAAVGRLADAARDAGARRVVPLPVSAPFHCPLMRPAAERLLPVLERLAFAVPRFPVVSNVDAAWLTAADAARHALARQVASPVRWDASVRALIAGGIRTFVEVGPGKTLTGLVRGIDRQARVLPAGDAAGVRAVLEELAA